MRKRQKFYKNNQLIKNGYYEEKFTQEQIQEIIKCKQDIFYFFENYIKITTLDIKEPIKLFKPWDFQKELLNRLLTERFNIVYSSRQSGKTTCCATFALWKVLFNPNFKILIAGDSATTAKKILASIKEIYENLPFFLQKGVLEWNKTEVLLDNKSFIKTVPTTENSGRGGTFNIIILEEFSFVKDSIAEAFQASVLPVICSGDATQVLIITTQNGKNFFYEMWQAAINGESIFKPFRIHWQDVPGRDEEWVKTQKQLLGEKKFAREFVGEFDETHSSLVDVSKLDFVKKEPIIIDDVLFYEKHNPTSKYVITVDLGEGLGSDYSTFSVFEILGAVKQVCTYRNKENNDKFCEVLLKTAKSYGAKILFENNNDNKIPYIFHNIYKYENLLFTKIENSTTTLCNKDFKSRRVGLKPTSETRNVSITALKNMLESKEMIISDFDTFKELETFCKNSKGKYEATEDNHDDLVSALMLMAWLYNDEKFKETIEINTNSSVSRLDLSKVIRQTKSKPTHSNFFTKYYG